MSRLRLVALGCLLGAWLAPSEAVAQTDAQARPAAAAAPEAGASNLWLVAGGSFSTLRGDCQTCEEDYPYRHSGSLLVNVGRRATSRMDVGFELLWMPVETASGQIRTTHIDVVAQFRPWASQGFFLKGGAGMALLRNWVDVNGPESIRSKALSVVIGGGWAFRPAERVGYQFFATQHAAAVGDLKTAGDDIQDVMGNFWSLGAALVIR